MDACAIADACSRRVTAEGLVRLGVALLCAFEKFTLEDQGDFTVCIKTFNGTCISTGGNAVAGQSYINRALKFRLQVFDLAPGPTG